MAIVVDSHQHFWDRSLTQFDNSWQENSGFEKICRSFMPNDLVAELQNTGVDKSVFVQTQHNVEENRWALQLADQNDFIAGVVGWVDLASDECESQLLEFIDHPKFVGVRHVTQDEPDEDFIVRDDVMRGLSILAKHDIAFDLLFYVRHLKHAAALAERFPNLRLVIDHLAKPQIKSATTDGWIEHFRAAAQFPNVWCKLSGMVTEADWANWKPADLKPYVETALELFGSQRCMYGSDWPVCELAASYEQVFQALVECIGGVSESEKEKILGQNAIDFYRLKI